MDKRLFDILNYVNEGIIITNHELEIIFWNKRMEELTNITESLLNTKVYEGIPSLNRGYFREAMNSVIEKDYKFFFSSVMHKGLISEETQLNVKLSRFESEGSKYLIVECIDVTSQIIRINQLKDYNNELHALNKKLKEQEQEITRK